MYYTLQLVDEDKLIELTRPWLYLDFPGEVIIRIDDVEFQTTIDLRTGIVQRRLIDEAVARGGARASMVIAGREPAKQKCGTGVPPQTGSDHDVSILITAVDAAGR